MPAEIKAETLETLFTCYKNSQLKLRWPSVFTLPFWMQSWWQVFGYEYELFVHTVYKDGRLLGIAPLMLKDGEARLIGSPDVCDYLDFITSPDKRDEEEFFDILLPYLKESGVENLILNAQRPDAAVFRGFFASERFPSPKAHFIREDQSYELTLASSWEDYLAALTKKQRHEVRRKLRRLQNEKENWNFRVLEKAAEVEAFIPDFFELFKENSEKENFLTDQMQQYFQTLISAGVKDNHARLGLLDIDGITAAAVLYFDYRDRIYLYNSGFKFAYRDLSAGLLSKVLCIKESITTGHKAFDFLKGQEVYKSRLGGNPIPIYTVTIPIS